VLAEEGANSHSLKKKVEEETASFLTTILLQDTYQKRLIIHLLGQITIPRPVAS